MALGYIRSSNFCVCLPLRAGVIVLALLGLGDGMAVAATGWLQVSQLTEHPLEDMDKAALFLHTVCYTTLAALSLFGIISAIIKKRGCILAYLVMLLVFLVMSIGVGVFTIYAMNTPNSAAAIRRCLNGAKDDLTNQVCRNGLAVIKGVAIAIYVATWALLSYACIVAYSFYKHLHEESHATHGRTVKPLPEVNKEAISAPAPLTMYNSAGAPGMNNGYAFSNVGMARANEHDSRSYV